MFTGHAEHTPIVHALAALPWIIWRWDVALRSARLRPAVEAGKLWGLSALAGYPGIVLINAGMAFLWLLGWLLFLEPDSPPSERSPARTPPALTSITPGMVSQPSWLWASSARSS